MKHKAPSFAVVSSLLTACFLSSCGDPLKSNNTNGKATYVDSKAATAQSAVALIETISSNSEVEPALATTAELAEKDVVKSSSPEPTATPTACLYNRKSRPGPCTGKAGNALAVSWTSCNSKNGDSIAGGYTDSFVNAASGAADTTTCKINIGAPLQINNGTMISRVIPSLATTYLNSPAGKAYRGAVLALDTNPQAAWDGTEFTHAALGITLARNGGQRILTFNGLHESLKTADGKLGFDHVHQGQVVIKGEKLSGDRAIVSGGQITTWHNSGKYTAIHTFANDENGQPVTWTNRGCCYPTRGQIETIYTGSVLGKSTLVFKNGVCGKATFIEGDGSTQPFQLSQCL